MMREVKVNDHILEDDKYALLFSVEEVNRLVLRVCLSATLTNRSV